VLMNLAANARDAMPAGGTLTLASSTRVVATDPGREHPEVSPGSYVELCVTDTGRGIDRDILPRIFEPFFTTKALGQGTGLGLATVYGIIKQSEGYIHCASEPLAGTTFTILLPLAPGEVPGAAPAPRAPRSLGGSESVLVVEDEEAIRGLVSTVLGRHGYRVRTARNGEEALAEAAAEADRLHLLLTDVVMPRMSGPELGRRVREICPHARVLYMSGFTDHPAMREDTAVEGEQLIRKPFTAEALLERVRAALDAGPAGS